MPHEKLPAQEEPAPRPAGLAAQGGFAPRPGIGLDHMLIEGRRVSLRERGILDKPFCQLLHFEADLAGARPPLLLVAPLSGMRAEILYDMILGLLPRHDVHCLVWKDAAEVPLAEGPFGLEDNIAHVVEAIRHLGAGTHVIGLCQSALPALAGAAILAGDPARPATLTLLAGKLDTRINPTKVDLLSRNLPLAWFQTFSITTVPPFRRGHGRRVYPASTALMMLSTYLLRHCASGGELLARFLHDDGSDAARHPFPRLFLSLDDVPAEFYLDTISQVFQRAALPRGRLAWQGGTVDPRRITRTALLTIEGTADDISGPGQTHVAHDLCAGIPAGRRGRLTCPHVGHIGLFFGSRWRQDVLPHIDRFIRENAD